MNFPAPPSRRGSALLLSLCAIAIMSLTVMSLVEWTGLGLDEVAAKERDFRALQLAESGVAMGLHPQVEKMDSVLNQEISPSESFSVEIKSEESRLNINSVLTTEKKGVLEDLFTHWGMKERERSVLIDCLIDWVDPNPLKSLNGAERKEYEAAGLIGYPPNRPFLNVEEMEMVRGIAALDRVKPDWKDYFTVCGEGKLDLNEAPADLIAAVCGVGSLAAETFVKRRLGSDGKNGTGDDFTYTDPAQIRGALGLSENAFKEIEDRITLKGEFRRVESTGKVGAHSRTISAVFKLNTNPIQYLSWTEF